MTATMAAANTLPNSPTCRLWTTRHSYKRSRFGMDWLMHWLQFKSWPWHWCLVVDPDEFFVYPFCDTRPLRALTDWLDASSIKSFSAMLLDMYPKGALTNRPITKARTRLKSPSGSTAATIRHPAQQEIRQPVDSGRAARADVLPRPARTRACDEQGSAGASWDRSYAYASSTHMLLPRGLNQVYDDGAEKSPRVSCCTPSFLIPSRAKAEEEMERKQHYANSHEYRAYRAGHQPRA
jgi:hypothetical protein